MRSAASRGIGVSLVLLLLCAIGPAAEAEAAEPRTPEAAGWEEGSTGWWSSLPERKMEAGGELLRAEVELGPGTGVVWEKRGNWDLKSGDALSLEMTSTGTNRTSRDYREHGAHFPLSVTVVFGNDSLDLPWKKRILRFFAGMWHGFPPGGISLTFAYGNTVPAKSMYRLGPEETVLILAGEEELGKTVSATRDLQEDFRAAYGRLPRGPVTKVLVTAERPSGEKGSIRGEIRLALPGR